MASTASVTVEVKSKADLAAVKQAKAELLELTKAGELSVEQTKRLSSSLGDLMSKGGLARLAKDAGEVSGETKKAAEGMDLFHINQSKALGETQVLVRELATGSFHARTLGSLMSALGPAITAGGISAILLFEAIKSINDAVQKLQENADRFNRELDRSTEKLMQMAKEAESIGDQVHLADAIHGQIQKASDELEDFVKKNKTFSIGDIFSIFGTGQLEIASQLLQKQEEVSKLTELHNKALTEAANRTALFGEALDKVYGGEGQAIITEWEKKVRDANIAVDEAAALANAHAKDPALSAERDKALENLRFMQAQLKELQQAWDETTRAEERSNAELERMVGIINDIIKKNDEWMEKQIQKDAKAFTDKQAFLQKLQDEAAINRATGDEEQTIQAKINKTYDDTLRSALAIKDARGDSVFTQEQAEAIANNQKESERQKLETLRAQGTEQSGLNVQMKEYEMILQDIRQQQQVTGAQAFIGPDQKNLQLLQQYRAEIANIINAMQQQQTRKGGLTDPAEIARANQELQKFSAQYQLLAAKIITTTHQFQAGLQSWANSFGSTGQQLANTLQQTVGTVLQSFNQWIVTGKFNMQQLLQSIALLGLQLVEQLIIQRVVAMINARLAETQAIASSKIIAAAWAGAATAVTIATEGQAAYSAPAAVAIGLAGVQAALGLGSLHEGGRVRDRRMHTGGLAADEVPIIAQEGEIMIRRDVAQREGMAEFLLGLNAGEFHDGGWLKRMHRGGESGDRMWDEFGRRFDTDVTPSWHSGHPHGTPMGPETVPNFPDSGGPSDPNIEPPALSEPDTGPPSTTATGEDRNRDFFRNFDPATRNYLNMLTGNWGYMPPAGTPGFLQGPTMIPTSFDPQGYPYAVPIGEYVNIGHHTGTPPTHQRHAGGMISRFHSGGAVGGKSGAGGGQGVHIYAFTDLKALTKHMASRDGQKIIFDTVKGRRIDLGMK